LAIDDLVEIVGIRDIRRLQHFSSIGRARSLMLFAAPRALRRATGRDRCIVLQMTIVILRYWPQAEKLFAFNY